MGPNAFVDARIPYALLYSECPIIIFTNLCSYPD